VTFDADLRRAAFDRAGTGLAILDRNGIIVRVNDAAAAAVGRERAELEGRSFTVVVAERMRSSALKVYKAAFASGTQEPGLWTVSDRNGRPIDALFRLQPLASEGVSSDYAVVSMVDVTDVQSVQKRLSLILAEQKALLDNTLVGIMFSRSGEIVRVNARCADLLGWRVDELAGQPTHAVFPSRPEYDRFAREVGPTLARGEPVHFEIETVRRGGGPVWLEVDAKPVNARGAEPETIWTLHDITGRKHAEAALAAVADEQRAILDNAFVGIAFTRDRHIERCNRRLAEMFGYAPEELAGTPSNLLFPDEKSFALLVSLATPPLGRGEPFRMELELRRRDGAARWCRVAAQAAHRDAPADGTVWICEDVTEERASADALRRTLRELELILDNATVGIVCARDGRIDRCNRRFEEILGYGHGEVDDLPMGRFFLSPEAEREFATAADPLLARGVPFETEARYRRRDGRPIWVRLSGRVADHGAPPGGRIWIVQDVSAQHDAQAALEHARTELEHRVRERTADIRDKNRALEAEISERRIAEDALRLKTERLNLQTTRLLALAQADKSDFEKALDEILGAAVETLGIDFASFWRMHEGGASATCERQYFAGRGPVFSSAGALVLKAEDHPAYFEALRGRHVLAAESAPAHAATASLTASYLAPLGVESSLHLPVWLDGRVVGIVCMESSRERRAWSAEDVDFASGTAVITALAIEAAQRHRAEERLRHLAHHDTLTGLPNRNLLDDRLQQALALAARQETRVAVMFLDLDRFKTINDSLGHLVGDRVLAQVGARLAGAVRAGDTVARLGGDEFVVLLAGIKAAVDAATVAAHLLQRLAPPIVVGGRELHVAASIGISLYPEDGDTVEALMRSADTAMYHAKDAGRNGFEFFSATMNATANRRLDVETELRAALKRGELELHYQPIYSVSTQALTGFEALVRWRHPRGELLMPGDFVPLAEETGLVHEIGRWALGEACAQLRQWQDQGLPIVPVAVNLSARQFRERDFVESVRRVLERTSLAPQMLEIEVTEGALMQHSAETKNALEALGALGVKISIDDFGVGYSNLVYLKRFAIDRIKIDQSFVRDIPAGGDDAAITAAIISMARTLRLHVVAEGVENGMQLAFLAAHGCDEVQGTYLCPPLPADATDRLFAPAH